MSLELETAIFDLLGKVQPGKSISPEEVARAADPESLAGALLGHVAPSPAASARQGKLVILRHNKPADPDDFKGVYRLRLPMAGDPAPPEPTPRQDPEQEETP